MFISVKSPRRLADPPLLIKGAALAINEALVKAGTNRELELRGKQR